MKKYLIALVAFFDFLAYGGGFAFAVILLLALFSGGVHFDVSPK